MRNTQVFLAQKYYGLSLVVEEMVGVSSLKLIDELDEVVVAVLPMVFGAQVCELILALDVVDADLALLHQFLHEKIPQRDVLCARTVSAVAGDVQRRRCCCCCCFLTLTDPLRIQPWSQDRRNQTKSTGNRR